jgi:hypothetical protein
MENVTVYSPIEDKKIRTEFQNSPIWKKAYTEEEYKGNPKKYLYWFKYSFKFDGLKPIQITKIQKLAN